MAIADGGLARRARLSRDGKDERVHLARLGALVAKGLCPADALLEGLETSEGGDFTGEMLRRAKMT